MLAQRVVAASWRLARAERLEAELFAREMHSPCGERGLGLALIRDCNGARAFDTLLRYRGGTLAELWRALRTLKALQAEAAAQAEVGASAPRLPPGPREISIEPESRADPDDSAPPRAASEPAPPWATSAPAVIACDRAATRTRLPDEPERRGDPCDLGRPGDRAEPSESEARPAGPALSLPVELAKRGGAAALLAGTARRRWP